MSPAKKNPVPASDPSQADRPTESSVQEYIDGFRQLDTVEIHRRLADALGRTVDGLKRAAACVRVLEERDEDLSYISGDLFGRLRLIAYGQLLPEVVFHFAGLPGLTRIIQSLPIPDQKRMAEGGKVEVAVRRGDSFDTRMMAPLDMTSDQIKQVFAGGRIRPVGEQIAHLESEPVHTKVEAARPRAARVHIDPKAATIKVGRATVPVKEVLGSLSDLAPVDPDADGPGGSVTVDPDLYGPLQRMAAAGGKTVRHLVRLAILRTYFPGDSA